MSEHKIRIGYYSRSKKIGIDDTVYNLFSMHQFITNVRLHSWHNSQWIGAWWPMVF